MPGYKILIADDHALFRSGLKQILADCPNRPEIEEAATGAEVLKRAAKTTYDCVLLDILMPDLNGFEVIKRLKALRPGVRVLVLSMYPEGQYGIRAIRAGAAGYMTKNAVPELLKEAVRQVCEGRKFISPSLAERLSDEIENGNGGRGGSGDRAAAAVASHERLSDRELQILTQMASGKTVSGIAGELHLSVKTVSTHRTHILQKMGMKNNAELINYAVKNGLVF